MSSEQITTLGAAILAGNISTGATSLTFTNAVNMPTQGTFRIRIDDQIYKVTGVSGSTYTIESESFSGNVDAAHSIGAEIEEVLTAEALRELLKELNGASVPAGGSLTTGNVLQVSGAGALSYGPLSLAGGANYVTGVLPTVNQASQALGGDLSGTTANGTVAKINGSSVPAGGSLTTGNLLAVTGAGALGYAPLNLAGGANYVTGVLPKANQGAQDVGGDLTGSTSSATVAKVKGTAVGTAAGSLTTGQILRVTGVSAADWGPIDLANANAVTGVLPQGYIGAGFQTQTAKAANYTVLTTDLDIPVDSTAGSFTVTLPASPSDASRFTITDVTGGCGGFLVTVAGGGHNIGPSSTFGMRDAFASLTVQYNSAHSVWVVIRYTSRQPPLWYSAVRHVTRSAATNASGNGAVGTRFFANDDFTCIGVRFYWIVASSKSVKVSLWDDSGTRLGSATVTVASTGVCGGFFSGVSLTAYARYRVSAWQTDGLNYTANSTTPYITGSNNGGVGVFWDTVKLFANSSGDLVPNTVATSETYGVEPILLYP